MSEKIYFSSNNPLIDDWTDQGDYFRTIVILVPRRWWSIKEWMLGFGLNKKTKVTL